MSSVRQETQESVDVAVQTPDSQRLVGVAARAGGGTLEGLGDGGSVFAWRPVGLDPAGRAAAACAAAAAVGEFGHAEVVGELALGARRRVLEEVCEPGQFT